MGKEKRLLLCFSPLFRIPSLTGIGGIVFLEKTYEKVAK